MTRPKAGLYIVSTPIGNLGDVSPRALETLAQADVVACEDTRVGAKLLSHFGIKAPKIFPVHDHNESVRSAEIVKLIEGGSSVVLVSDSGTPVISDPGFKVARAVADAGLYMTAVPGACAAINALVLSALPSDKFSFAGFAPRGRNELAEFFAEMRGTTIFYESPVRLTATLSSLAKVAPDAHVAVAREMTKMFEEVVRGTSAEVAEHFLKHAPRGEIVVVVSKGENKPVENWKKFAKMFRSKLSAKDAAELMSKAFGASKKEIYDYIVQI